ncbi:MAG: hypothetical protein KKB50_16665 [Planctomycetes bacterium]|nr:hypothetical protein [Planctomycetota bacterium]
MSVLLGLVGGARGEIIGPYDIQAAPTAARLISGGSSGWLNVVNASVDYNAAFSGFSIIDDGMANEPNDTIVEMDFAAGAAVNIAGSDLVMFDGRFSENSYYFSVDYDGFATELSLPLTAFSDTGVNRTYYYNGAGPYDADVMAAEIDLSFFGVPLGGSVTSVRFRTTDNGQADPLGVGSLVPEPASATLLCLGALALIRRR